MPAEQKKHAIRNVVRTVCATPWAIEPQKLDEIVELLNLRAEGATLDEEEIRQRLAAARPTLAIAGRVSSEDGEEAAYRLTEQGIALIPLYGVLAPRMNMMTRISGGTSTEQFADAVRQAVADDQVRAIVLDVDSPGGNVQGTEEAAQAVREARSKKPTIAVATNLMASAAYHIGSAAAEIVASPTALVGSLGVFTVHSESSENRRSYGVRDTVIKAGKFKTDGNAYEPLGQQGRATIQERIDDYYELMIGAVAENRRVSVETVNEQFGQGKAWVAHRAVSAGLADRIGTLSGVMAELARKLDSPSAVAIQSTENMTMDKEIFQALVNRGLIAAEATEAEAAAALKAWYAATGGKPPADAEGKLDAKRIVTDLTASASSAGTTASSAGTTASSAGTTASSAGTTASSAGTTASSAAPAEPERAEGREDLTARDRRLRADAAAAERVRIEEIRSRGELLGVAAETIQAAVDEGTSLADFLDSATKNLTARETSVPRLESGQSAQERFADAACDALLLRCGVALGEDRQPSEGARALEYGSLIDLTKESFRVASGRAPIGSNDTIAKAALGDPEAMRILGADFPAQTPGSFPNILANVANRTLEAAPQYVGTTFQNWAARRPSVPDFRPQTLVRFGTFGEFPLHVDGDNFEQSELSEDYAWLSVDSYGDEFGLTPRMMVDDDLGAFMDALGDKQAAHDQTLNRLCVNLLTGNVLCADGVALFNAAGHQGNDILAGAGGQPSTAQLSAMRTVLRQQTGVGGTRQLNQTIARLLVPEALETVTQQLLAATLQIHPIQETATPVFKGQVAWDVEPMLTAHSAAIYYGFADPARARSIVYCYQRGFERMVTRNYYNPQNNCRFWQFEGRFAAAVNNYRGVIRNAGA